MRRPAGFLLALVSVASAQLDFSAPSLEKRAGRLVPAIEKALGEPIGAPLKPVTTTSDGLAELIAKENTPLAAGLEDAVPGPELEKVCRQEALLLSKLLFAKIDTADRVIRIVPQCFEDQADSAPELAGIRSPGFLDVILVHEAVHVYQDRKFGIMKFIGKPRTQDELKARFSVLEGHAQHVTRQVAKDLDLGQAFDLYVKAITEVPSTVRDPALKLLAPIRAAEASFSYVEGEKFVAALIGRLGREEALDRVFRSPPKTLAEVSDPDRYGLAPSKEPSAFDLARRFKPLFDPERHATEASEISDPSLRSVFSVLEAERTAPVLKRLRGAAALVAQPKDRPPGEHLVLALIRADSPEGAGALVDLIEQLSRKKDELLRAEKGMLELRSADYESLDRPDPVPTLLVTKKLYVRQVRRTLLVRTLVLRRGSLVLEMLSNNTGETREQFLELGRKAFEAVQEPAPAGQK
jgi:hypothetical protein